MDKEQHYYCLNLAQVNQQQAVVATQPIYNQQGVLLLAEGTRLDENRAQVLLQHKLMKPLEQTIGLAKCLDARHLFDYLNKFAATIPGLAVVTEQEHYQKLLRQMCLFYERHPLLQQNLTLLALRAREIYYNGLFSAMAGLAIAQKLELDMAQLRSVFIAGLFHDIGFLYLPPDLIHKQQDFTAEEWRALQAHPLIAQRFLQLIPQLPADVGLAIADHHERLDGTGYPRQLFGDKLSMTSQIIAATDNIIFNHQRYRQYGVHAHKMLLAALKLSDNIYFEGVYNAAMVLFQAAPAPTEEVRQVPLTRELIKRQQQLRAQFEQARQLAQLINQAPSNNLARSINTVMGRLAIAIARSGILQPEQEQWLDNLGQNDSEGFSLLEMSVMEDQITDQLIHVKNLMERFAEQYSGNTMQGELLVARLQDFNVMALA